jgi:hypothetical protein
MKFVALAITVHALCMSFVFSAPGREGPFIGMAIAGLFLAIGLVYCTVDLALKKKS